MSHEFRLACKTCNLETEEVNHAKENIREFVEKWEENKNAITKILSLKLFDIGDVRESFRSKSLPVDIYEFMLLHEGHELVVKSEYASVADELIKVEVKNKMLSFKLEEEFNNLFSIEEYGYGYVKLKTPFTLPDGTAIDVYLKLNKDGEIEHITDLGCTLGRVYLNSSEDITEDFWEKVKDVEVDLIGEMLITKPRPNAGGIMPEVFKLITAIIRVSSLI